jgi:nucleoside-diphosphate-sugar epimerase
MRAFVTGADGFVGTFLCRALQEKGWKIVAFALPGERVDPLVALGATVRRGDFLGFNPHAHILVTDGCFYGNKGMFLVASPWYGWPPCARTYRTGRTDGVG